MTAADIYKRMGIRGDAASPEQLATLLTKMQMRSTATDGGKIEVEVPPTRPDILHACDIWEDAAVAYGFTNIDATEPKVVTAGKQLPINNLTDHLRLITAQAGYAEALTFALCTKDDNFKNLRRPDDGKTACIIANPKTRDFQVARTNLISGLLRTLYNNSSMPLPVKVPPLCSRLCVCVCVYVCVCVRVRVRVCVCVLRPPSHFLDPLCLSLFLSFPPFRFLIVSGLTCMVQLFEINDVVLLDPSTVSFRFAPHFACVQVFDGAERKCMLSHARACCCCSRSLFFCF